MLEQQKDNLGIKLGIKLQNHGIYLVKTEQNGKKKKTNNSKTCVTISILKNE